MERVTKAEDITESNFGVLSTLLPTSNNESEVSTVAVPDFATLESVNSTSTTDKQPSPNEFEDAFTVFQALIIVEILMTAFELIITIWAAAKLKRWRKNYRNQMLMQLSLVRFIKRIFGLIAFYKKYKVIAESVTIDAVLITSQIYNDFVIVILVFFFIRHMYDSLIIVLVKISQHSLVRVLTCAWLLPLPVSILGASLVLTGVVQHLYVYLTICAVFRWPLMLVGTVTYITILYRVLTDQIMRFARSLTVITFLLCLVINFYLFSNDVIWLFCLETTKARLATDLSGLIMNFLILGLYIVLITLTFQHKSQSSKGSTR